MSGALKSLITFCCGFIKTANLIKRGEDVDCVIAERICDAVGEGLVGDCSPTVGPARRVPLAIIERACGDSAADRSLPATARADGGPGVCNRAACWQADGA